MAQAGRAILLENKSDIAQHVWYQDKREQIAPYGVRAVNADLARLFLAERGEFVKRFEEISVPHLQINEKTTFIANMTGNPFVEPTVTVKRIHRGKEEDYELDNPFSTAKIITHKMNGGQLIQQCANDASSYESINLPGTVIRIPPYRRVRIGRIAADWLLRRDLQQLQYARGQLREVSEPYEFEPNEAWPLDDLRLMAKLMDPQRFTPNVVGPSEAELDPSDVDDAATKLWHKMFFTLIDERYPAITEAEFLRTKKDMLQRKMGGGKKEDQRLANAKKQLGGQASP
jgi:hypothetical protein